MRKLKNVTSTASQCIRRILYCLAVVVPVQTAVAESEIEQLRTKLEQQEARIEQLERLLDKPVASDKSEDNESSNTTEVGYNRGFSISEQQGDESFALKINGRMQFRYTGFSPKRSTYRFDNGTTGSQTSTNDFEIERGRLEFSGHMVRPELRFYLNLDFDTDDNHDVKAHDFWFQYEFDRALTVYAGKAFVPGSREWIDGSTTTHLVDRSMATSFFRPDRSLGIWVIGEPSDGFYYRAMVSNGFQTTDLEREDIDNKFTYALSLWGDLFGNYGKGAADLEWHENLAVRIGSSFTYSPIDVQKLGEPIGEASAVRLSDGTKLSAEGALGAGVNVRSYDLFLYAVDLAAKYRGWSVNSEFYYRSIEDVMSDTGLALDTFDDMGFTVDTGYFFVQSLLEGVLRFSYVDGDLSDAAEYAAGVNYYVHGTHKNKFSFDVTMLEDTPISSSGPNLFVGATGLLYRLQWQVAF